jgi:HK97 family phage portal protein
MKWWPFSSKRSSSVSIGHPKDKALQWFFGAKNTASGVRVDAETVMRLNAVHACVRVLSEDISTLPISLFRERRDGSKQKIKNHAVKAVLRKPNKSQTRVKFLSMMLGHFLLRGNAYAEKIYLKNGKVSELIPLHPDRVTPFWAPDQTVAYAYRDKDDSERIILNHEMHHFSDLSSDILLGESRIDTAREALGHAMATEEYGARIFSNGAVPGAVLKHPAKLSKDASDRIIKSWEDRHSGVSKSHRPAILEEGMSYEKIGITAQDAQFLESRKFNRSEICGIFRVPPHKIADLDRSTFSNIEHQSINYVSDAIRPIVVNWEEQLARDLLSDSELEKDYYFSFNLEGLLRGDIKTRYEAYAIGRDRGWLNADDIREKEDMNPLPDGQGKIYLVPLNMVPADQVANGGETDL